MFSSSQPSLLNFVMLPVGGKFVSTLWLWAYAPVSWETLEVQHTGVVTKARLNVAPGPLPLAAPIASSMPGTRLRERSSWSSVSRSTMFGFTLALPRLVFGSGALHVLIFHPSIALVDRVKKRK